MGLRRVKWMEKRGPVPYCNHCLFGDPLRTEDCDLIEWPGCKSEMERMQTRVGTLERMGEDHEVRVPIYQMCEGGLTLWLTGQDLQFRLRDPGQWLSRANSRH